MIKPLPFSVKFRHARYGRKSLLASGMLIAIAVPRRKRQLAGVNSTFPFPELLTN